MVWVLAFLALLRPDMFGALLAVMLTLLNVLESSVYLILLPDERWILVTTVLARTALLITIAIDFLGQIWPQAQAGIRLQRVAVRLAASVMAATLVVVLVGAPHAAQAYQARRLAEHPCRQTIAFLHAEANGLTRTIAMEETELWRDLYPWLRQAYTLVVVDGYNPEDRPFELVKAEKLAALAEQGEFWWIERANGTAEWAQAAMNFFARPNVYRVDAQQLDGCKLVRVFVLDDVQPIGMFDATSGQIVLRGVQLGEAKAGATLPLVLYWQAMTPIEEDYTVFTQLFAPNGHMVAQQDNPPMRGQAPTSAWRANETMRDVVRR